MEHYCSGSTQSQAPIFSGGAAGPTQVIFVDDNMHYRSMRLAYYHIARSRIACRFRGFT